MDAKETYLKLDELKFPIRHSVNSCIELRSLEPMCGKCGKPGKMLRGKVVEHESCLEIETGVVCFDCMTMSFGIVRAYRWGFLLKTPEGWQEIRPSLWQSIKGYFTNSEIFLKPKENGS